jgi:hypothetical protein
MFIGRVSTANIFINAGCRNDSAIILISLVVSNYDAKPGSQKKPPAILAAGRIPTWIAYTDF